MKRGVIVSWRSRSKEGVVQCCGSLQKYEFKGEHDDNFHLQQKVFFLNSRSRFAQQVRPVIYGVVVSSVRTQGLVIMGNGRFEASPNESKNFQVNDHVSFAVEFNSSRAVMLENEKKVICSLCGCVGHKEENCVDKKVVISRKVCRFCGSTNHTLGNCSVLQYWYKRLKVCANCGELGHFAQSCTKDVQYCTHCNNQQADHTNAQCKKRCVGCNKSGHSLLGCYSLYSSVYNSSLLTICNNCGALDHESSQCPQKIKKDCKYCHGSHPRALCRRSCQYCQERNHCLLNCISLRESENDLFYKETFSMYEEERLNAARHDECRKINREKLSNDVEVKPSSSNPHRDVCYNCGTIGHDYRACPKPKAQICHVCGSNSHSEWMCRTECRYCKRPGHSLVTCYDFFKNEEGKAAYSDTNFSRNGDYGNRRDGGRQDHGSGMNHYGPSHSNTPLRRDKIHLGEENNEFNHRVRRVRNARNSPESPVRKKVKRSGPSLSSINYEEVRSGQFEYPSFRRSRSPSSSRRDDDKDEEISVHDIKVCNNCGKFGHLSRDCELPKSLQCDICLGSSHSTWMCYLRCLHCQVEGHNTVSCEKYIKNHIKKLKEEKRDRKNRRKSSSSPPRQREPLSKTESSSAEKPCFNCGKFGHRTDNCDKPWEGRCKLCYRTGHSMWMCFNKCFYCNEDGHSTVNCDKYQDHHRRNSSDAAAAFERACRSPLRSQRKFDRKDILSPPSGEGSRVKESRENFRRSPDHGRNCNLPIDRTESSKRGALESVSEGKVSRPTLSPGSEEGEILPVGEKMNELVSEGRTEKSPSLKEPFTKIESNPDKCTGGTDTVVSREKGSEYNIPKKRKIALQACDSNDIDAVEKSRLESSRNTHLTESSKSNDVSVFDTRAAEEGSFLRAMELKGDKSSGDVSDDEGEDFVDSDFLTSGNPLPDSKFYGVRTSGPLLQSVAPCVPKPEYLSRSSRVWFQNLFYGRQYLPLLDRLPCFLRVDGLKCRQITTGGFSFNKGQQSKEFAKEVAESFAVFDAVIPECEITSWSWKNLREGKTSYSFLKYPDAESGDEAMKKFNGGAWKGLKNVKPEECRICVRRKEAQRVSN